MASPRLRRLLADYHLILNEFTGNAYVTVEPAGGNPPERYQVTYRVTGVKGVDRQGMPDLSNRHVVDVYLHQDYPREKPKCSMRTPVFHPNIKSVICIADHWAPGETLVDVIVQIGRMIQYQTYNPASALDIEAARWAVAHPEFFPVGAEPLLQPELDIRLSSETIPLAPEPPETEGPRL